MFNLKRPNYEEDSATFPAEAYTVKGYRGVAWRVYGWELEGVFAEYEDVCFNCEDGITVDEQLCKECDGTGKRWVQEVEPEEVRTGKVVCVMVGDDRRFTFDPDELTPLADLDYCASCGQIGCVGDGRDRT